MGLRVVCAVLFSPRGGSAHVARAIARGLREQGCEVTLVAGSRGDLGPHGDARRFYGEVHAVDFGPALASGAPIKFEGPPGTAPIHPSYEDRPGAPDIVFARLDGDDYERQVGGWARELARAGAAEADVLYLHHLTPLNEAAARVAPAVPVVGHLHGTELLMLEAIEAGPPPEWAHARAWARRLREWGSRCARLCAAPGGLERAAALLDYPKDRLVALPNGVDLDSFFPRPIDRQEFWSRVLVDTPQGTLPGREAGSLRYPAAAVAGLAQAPVLLYVGRFTAVKRLDLLIAAFARAREQAPGALVLVGGHPGEHEGEHPAEVVARLGARDVYLAGWYPHEQLPDFLLASDAIVLASAREQFGQVLVEGMACGLPAVATPSPGPSSIIEDGRTGWLAPGDDESALAATLLEVLRDHRERRRRGAAAREVAVQKFSWTGIAARVLEVLEDVALSAADGAEPPPRRPRTG